MILQRNYFQKKNEFNIDASSDICYNEIKNEVNNELRLMVQKNNEHNFSSIYYPTNNPDRDMIKMFDDSIKDTINNVVPLNSNTIIMAYGPSGSGKTFNLIGDKFDTSTPNYGLIYKVLEYLNSKYNENTIENDDKIKSIELSSWQYYMHCGKLGAEPFECKRFNSMAAFDESVINNITNIKLNSIDFVDTLNEHKSSHGVIIEPIKYVYKYERSNTKKPGTTNGVQTFTANKFDVKAQSSSDVRGLLVQGINKNNTDNIENKYFEIDDGIKKGITDTDFQNWVKNVNGKDKRFRLSLNTFYDPSGQKIITLSKIHSIACIEENEKKQKDMKNKVDISVYINIDDFTGDLITKYLVKTSGVAKTLNKEGKRLFATEAKILLAFTKRFYEYGSLTVPGFKELFDEVKKNENKPLYKEPIVLKLGDKAEIKNTFTKFYLALVRARPTRATINNPDSSRTHLVVNLKIKKHDDKVSNLRFVDLAGNEKADENYFMMRREGLGITTSLIAIKNLLKAKQKNEATGKITDEDQNTFFTACKSTEEIKTCVNLYNKCIKEFETNVPKEYKLLDLTNDITTVSMYLNLPSYLKKEEHLNQCAAIADSLFFIRDLQRATQVSKTIDKLSDEICNNQKIKYDNLKSKFGKNKRRRSRRGGSAKRSRVRKGYTFVKFKKSTKSGKKYDAVFQNAKTGRTKTISFGSKGMSDYTKHKDNDRKYQYLKRHRKRENWNNLMTAGALSRWVLWNKKSLKASMADYKKRFNGR